MFFSAYLGGDEGERDWLEAIQRHAAWLGLGTHISSRRTADGRVFAFGWASLRPPDTSTLVLQTSSHLTIIPLDTLTRAEALASPSPKGFITNAVRMDLSLESGEVRVSVPVLTTEQFYYTGDVRGWVFGNDLRLMLRWAGLKLDEQAFYSLIHYGFISPPLTMSKTVSRIPPGNFFLLQPGSDKPSVQRFFDAADLPDPQPAPSPDERVRAALDCVLSRVPSPSAMHFSGGVDSGLLAARMVALGHSEVRLQNLSTGSGDIDSQLAPQMAAHLGLACEQVMWRASDIPAILGSVGREYSFPLGDSAAIPTMMSVRAMDQWQRAPSMLIEGTGAGSLFEIGEYHRQWRLLYAIPRPLREVIAATYPLGFWKYDSKAVRIVSAVQQSVQLSRVHAGSGGHSTLLSLAYDMPPEIRAGLREAFKASIESVSAGLKPRDQFSFVGLVRFCAHFSAARTFDPMRLRGIPVMFPYMEPAVVRAGYALSWKERCEGGELKAPLKRLLAESVPREWVYRDKGSFLLPFREMFTEPGVRTFVRDVVMSPRNPLMAFCIPGGVEQVARRAERGQPLHVGARKFLWTLTFASAWLEQVQRSVRD